VPADFRDPKSRLAEVLIYRLRYDNHDDDPGARAWNPDAPASLREKHRLGEGDPLTVVDLGGTVLLSARLLVVPRLAAEMEHRRRARKLSLKYLGVRED
jgi:hypothetical protein